MKKLSLLLMAFTLSGCALVNVSKDERAYQRDVGNIPKDRELSFKSKEAMAAGAALSNVTAAKIYYKGTEAESKEAKILYDITYRFMGLCGVNMSFDPSDPTSVERIFQEADNAIREKDENIHKLKQELSSFKDELATKEKIVRDKGTELKNYRSKWHGRLGSLAWGIGITITVVLALLLGAQIYTGIPFFTTTVTFGFNTLSKIWKAAKQTSAGIEKWKRERDSEIEKLRVEGKGHEANALERARDSLGTLLGESQDEDVKEFIKKKLGMNS